MGHGTKGRDYHLRNIVYSRLSSFEIGILPGIRDTFSSLPRRAKQTIGAYVPFIVAGYLLLDWMDKENWRSHRKDIKQFENDQ